MASLQSENRPVEEAMPDIKPQPGTDRYLEIMQGMTGGQRMEKAFELTAMSRSLFRTGLRNRFPDLSEQELHQVYLRLLETCHNQNY